MPAFDEARAFHDVETQVAFGPRVPGTEAHRRCRDWLAAELERAGAKVSRQSFTDSLEGLPVELTNVRGRYGPATGPWIVLGAHWDTRPWADLDPDTSRHRTPIDGANDGASGVAVLLEVGRVFAAQPPPIGVEIVFFDGEDMGRGGEIDTYCRGSRHYVRELVHPKPALAIVADMVGDRDLALYQEENSLTAARNIVERIWSLAEQSRAPAFIASPRHNVYDDHARFIDAGIPAVDIIDFDYPAWHTVADRTDRVSAASLGQVGRTLLRYVYTSAEE